VEEGLTRTKTWSFFSSSSSVSLEPAKRWEFVGTLELVVVVAGGGCRLGSGLGWPWENMLDRFLRIQGEHTRCG
jgi:hypothetical protein